MRFRIVLLISLCALMMVAAVAGAGERMVLQAQPKAAQEQDPCDIFYVCSYWHEVSPDYCTVWHVIYCGPIESAAAGNELEKAFVGRQLKIENRSDVRRIKISRVAPQYHLASGAVVSPQGEWNPRDAGGEVWGEVKPNVKRSYHVAGWEDTNADGIVSAGDRVTFGDGTRSQIKAVRFGVEADVIESHPRAPEAPGKPSQQ